jgi:uncharacterized cupin superfamily protein
LNKSTLDLDEQIGFLEGHVTHLTQSISQLALKPGDEDIKKKGTAVLVMKEK